MKCVVLVGNVDAFTSVSTLRDDDAPRPRLPHLAWFTTELSRGDSAHIYQLARKHPHSASYASVYHDCILLIALTRVLPGPDEREVYALCDQDAGAQRLPREHASLFRAVTIIDFDISR